MMVRSLNSTAMPVRLNTYAVCLVGRKYRNLPQVSEYYHIFFNEFWSFFRRNNAEGSMQVNLYFAVLLNFGQFF